MKLSAYPKTAPSQIQWLGDLPSHWQPIPLKYVTRFVNGMAFKPDEWTHDGVPIIRIENLNGGEEFNGFDGEVLERYHVKKGDLLFGWSGNRGTSFGPFDWPREGLHYLNQHIFRLAEFECDKRWFYWTLKALTTTIEDEAHGIIGMVHITKGDLGALKIPSIQIPEQRQIAAFLDWKTAQIDALIARKQELLEKLKDKRIAVITQAVTRGLNPAGPVRDSGIPWIGQVPEHWEVKRLKFSVSKVGSGVTPKGGAESYEQEGIPLLRSQNVHFDGLRLDDIVFISEETHQDMSNSQVAARDVLLNITGASIGRCNYVPDDFGEANVNQHVCIIRPAAELLTKYLYLVLWSKVGQSQIDLEQSGSGREGLTFIAIKNFVIPLPNTAEQAHIVEQVERSLGRVEALLQKTEAVIACLSEYRTALITAATTGKIDVRNVKIPEPVA